VNDDRRSADERRDGDGEPRVWDMDRLMRPFDPYADYAPVEIPRYESVFGPQMIPVRWR
jgi:hypothetical protein